MDKGRQLAAAYVHACSDLAAYLSDRLKDSDPQAYAALQKALGLGAQATLSLTVDLLGRQQISLDLVAGDSRLPIVQWHPEQQVRH